MGSFRWSEQQTKEPTHSAWPASLRVQVTGHGRSRVAEGMPQEQALCATCLPRGEEAGRAWARHAKGRVQTGLYMYVYVYTDGCMSGQRRCERQKQARDLRSIVGRSLPARRGGSRAAAGCRRSFAVRRSWLQAKTDRPAQRALCAGRLQYSTPLKQTNSIEENKLRGCRDRWPTGETVLDLRRSHGSC